MDGAGAVEVGSWIRYSGVSRDGWIGRVTRIGPMRNHFDADWVTPTGLFKRHYTLWASKLVLVAPTEEEVSRWMIAELSK